MTFNTDQEAVLNQIKVGATSSWVLAASAVIFFMQLGFIMLEAAVVRRQHWSGVVMKNMIETIAGAFGFWTLGFALAFSETDQSGFIGTNISAWAASKSWASYTDQDVYLKFIFEYAFVNTTLAIVGNLMTERIRIGTIGVLSFIITFFIYPVVACWVWNPTGWLAVRGYHDFAGSSVVHLIGGAAGLIGIIVVG